MFTKILQLLGIKPKKVVYLTTLTTGYKHYDNDVYFGDTHISYVLTLEDNKRKCKINGGDSLGKPKEHKLYIHVIKPWLQGADTLYYYLLQKGLPISDAILENSGKTKTEYTKEMITGKYSSKIIQFKQEG